MNTTMKAIVTTGNGGYDKLVYSDVPMPIIGDGEGSVFSFGCFHQG